MAGWQYKMVRGRRWVGVALTGGEELSGRCLERGEGIHGFEPGLTK